MFRKKPRTKKRNGVFIAHIPDAPSGPLVMDSPHSGRDYPKDFDYACDFEDLRRAEDILIDQIFDFVPGQGVPFLKALFPRSYIDPNRSCRRVDRKIFRKGEGDKIRFVDEAMGTGLVRRFSNPVDKVPIYDRKLSLKDVFNRLSGYYYPYHDQLQKMIDRAVDENGGSVFVSCHSMPSKFNENLDNPYDICLGTNKGASCDPKYLQKLKELFEAKGYSVGINAPYFSGGHMIARFSNVEKNRHAILLEVNRKLYADEENLSLHNGAAQLKADLADIIAAFDAYTRHEIDKGLKPHASAKPHQKRRKI